jgi:UDP:flavonoid glycosyltransferase YjiC (YdhE family)
MTALAGRLEQRGHSVVLFGVADCESRVRAAGINFRQIGAADYPPGKPTSSGNPSTLPPDPPAFPHALLTPPIE